MKYSIVIFFNLVMPRLVKSVEIVDNKITVCFKNAAGELHRENGPAMIIINSDSKFYKYYVNGVICRRQKNGIDQPAYIVKIGLFVSYQFYNNGIVDYSRDNGNLPYYVRKYSDFPSYGLRYDSFCIIQNTHYKRILLNIRNMPLYDCPNVVTYQLESGQGKRQFSPRYSEDLITPEYAHDRIGRVIIKNAEHLPLSQHF